MFSDKPQVSLRLGKSLDPDNLRTGNDVYFECDIRANPIPHKLLWRVNVSIHPLFILLWKSYISCPKKRPFLFGFLKAIRKMIEVSRTNTPTPLPEMEMDSPDLMSSMTFFNCSGPTTEAEYNGWDYYEHTEFSSTESVKRIHW